MISVPNIEDDTHSENDLHPTGNYLKQSIQIPYTQQPVKADQTKTVENSKNNIKLIKRKPSGKYSNTYRKAMKNIKRMYSKKTIKKL